LVFLIASFLLIHTHELFAKESSEYIVNVLKIKTLSVANEHYEAQSDFHSIIIPIKRVGKLILLDAYADSASGSLILDTGSAGMSKGIGCKEKMNTGFSQSIFIPGLIPINIL